jgi:hypothetical protein
MAEVSSLQIIIFISVNLYFQFLVTALTQELQYLLWARVVSRIKY